MTADAVSHALSANWRDFLKPAEAKRLAEIEAILEVANPLYKERREIEIKARSRSRSARLRKRPAAECGCYACAKSSASPEELTAGTMAHAMKFGRYFLCESCGNKRCPHAADHRNACTGSNAPGQKGSLYESAAAWLATATAYGGEPAKPNGMKTNPSTLEEEGRV
jgi:hypothetical protein